jgi:DNA-binding MurR/RpiR family transcriptional regulator
MRQRAAGSTPTSFDDRVESLLDALSPAEQRVARYFQQNREEVLIGSAAALAAKMKTSDATVIRTVRALKFSGLDELRRALADELRSSLSPADRLTRTLGEVGGSVTRAFEMTLDIHARSIESLRHSINAEMFERAVEAILAAPRVLVFGLGPSSAIASYLVIQLGRFGLIAHGLSNSGLLFADDLQTLRDGDLVVMLAYGRVYAELAALLDEIERLRLNSILLTDSLASRLRDRVDLILPVPRGRADMLSMHTATLGFIEALLLGVAAKRPDQTLTGLHALNRAREKLAGKSTNLPVTRRPLS